MQNRTSLLIASLAVVLFSGCLDGDELSVLGTATVPAAGLQAEKFYEFSHRGGTLQIGLSNGDSLALHLYDPDDNRLGRLELAPDTFGNDVALEALKPGAYVIGIEALNGTVDIQSAGQVVESFRLLGNHVERVVLATADVDFNPVQGFTPLGGLGPASPVDEQTDVSLLRTPTYLDLLLAGEASALQVRVTGPEGDVLRMQDTQAETYYGAPSNTLIQLPIEFLNQNAKGGAYQAHVTANDFEGVLVLQAHSYSRYQVANLNDAYASSEDVAFTYGELPGRPVLFQVHDRATALYAWARDPTPEGESECGQDTASTQCEFPVDVSELASTLAIYGPDDTRIGIYHLLPGMQVKIPIPAGGDYVAVSRGLVVLGADAVPLDFEMHVLDTETQIIGGDAPGSSTNYEQRFGKAELAGVAYQYETEVTDPGAEDFEDALLGQFEGCGTIGMFRIISNNETIDFWSEAWHGSDPYGGLAVPQDFDYWQDGTGGRCGQAAARVHMYLR